MTQRPPSRKVFFSFDYDEDRNRAEVVCASWRTHHPDSTAEASFVDSGIWQEAKALSEESVQRLIRQGIGRTSVTCVLVGAHTWDRRWARCEIAQSIEQGNGLLAVRINGIADTRTRQTSAAGANPLAYMGLGKNKDGHYFIFENSSGQWIRYPDYALPLAKPSYLPEMSVGYVQPLTVGLFEYDYIKQDGAKNLLAWIDRAAQSAGK
jgi:antiphage defense system Thoeris ThsB-like protein